MTYLPKTQQLIVFQEVVRCGGIRAAARSLGQTQPSVTKTISELEKNFGVELLIRNNVGIELTKAGKVFHSHSRSILQGLTRSVSEMQNMAHNSAIEISFGFSSLVSFTCLPNIIKDFKQAYPDAKLAMQEAQLSSLLPGLREGRLDFAIGTVTADMPIKDFNITPLFEDKFAYLAAKDHPLSRCESLHALRNADWILPETDMGYYHELMGLFDSNDFNPRKLVRTDSVVTIYNLVTYAGFITVLSEFMKKPLGSNALTIIPIKAKLPTASYAIVSYKNNQHSSSVKYLLERVKYYFSSISEINTN
ncbi:transcriptional regulator TdcA [Rouxiella sp. Mn2063]|uniref:transcriptional regulator TdcA n=1 Tax=Rouxiella sp. Mn2063 TaxID=3395262 RepID=UPI003BCEA219